MNSKEKDKQEHTTEVMHENETMYDTLFNIDVIHGGTFRGENCYIGGKTSVMKMVEWVRFDFQELEQFINSLGYHSILKCAFRRIGDVESYIFFHDDDGYNNEVGNHIDFEKSCLKIYVQCLNDDLTEQIETDKDKGKAIFDGVERINRLDEPIVDGEDEDNTVISEYESSNDSPYSLDSEEDLGYRKSKHKVNSKIYKTDVDKKSLIFEIGTKFKDFSECKEGIRNWAIENGYNICWKKSSEKKLEARCDGECPWMLYASRLPHESTFVIKTMMDEHTCVRSGSNRQVTKDWLANILIPILKRNSNYPAKEMVHDIQLKYGITVTEDLCYRAKWKALERLRGSFKSHYEKLGSYISHLQQMDKEGRFLLKTNLDENNQPVFERAYIGFSALRKGFLIGCRKCICFDACFLKTALGGALLVAVAKDCNNKMWPISWAVVEKESENTWTWFFTHLFEDLNIIDGFGWTFMSDKHKGIINSILKLTPNAEHRHCARHIYANWKKQFSGPKLKGLFWGAVKCSNENEFKFKMSLLKDESNEGYEQFMDQEPRKFCKSLISAFTKTDTIDNNICESFNSYILKSRDKPIIDMLEEIRLKLMTRMPEIVRSLNASSDILCPNVSKKLGRLQISVQSCIINPAMDKKFEVHAFDEILIVDLLNKECSCRSWSLTGIPCFHAIACIRYVRDDPASYVDRFYHRSNCLNAYKHYLTPIHGQKDWPIVDEPAILPPYFVRQPGRLRKNRRKDVNEELRVSRPGKQKLSNKGIRLACTRCKGFGHNVRTCKEPPPQSQECDTEHPLGKKKAGRPRNTHNVSQELGTNLIQQREMRQVRKGYGVLTGESGNIYIRPPGAKRTRVLRQLEDEGVSQSSQVIDGSTPTS